MNIPGTDKLYRVTLKGMTSSSGGVAYGISYVVAKHPTEAYDKVRIFLRSNDIGFSGDRELDKIELIAEGKRYTDTGTILYI